MTASPPDVASTAPLHGCVRCGAPIPLEESMCERCNPLGLRAPAASQAHATVFAGIGVAVVIMAVVARMTIAGVGPFRSSVARVVADPAGLKVTVSVTNGGSAAGSTTCRIDDPSLGGIGPEAAYVESPRVDPGATVVFDVIVASLGTQPRALTADCES
jgi:predicted nucleic acid-binding Zn ribbon protein